ncbi:hypothetical protein HOK96_04210 [bacterium]|nr:hypothetical protein [bacterium]MBT5346223.1 hypothetical protein [bacterium]MBT6131019.1 hypothetical protein [bacterium]
MRKNYQSTLIFVAMISLSLQTMAMQKFTSSNNASSSKQATNTKSSKAKYWGKSGSITTGYKISHDADMRRLIILINDEVMTDYQDSDAILYELINAISDKSAPILIKGLFDSFIVNKSNLVELKKQRPLHQLPIHIWNMYLSGHGDQDPYDHYKRHAMELLTKANYLQKDEKNKLLSGSKIMSRPVTEFSKKHVKAKSYAAMAGLPLYTHFTPLLNYLNNNIKTNFLMYNSCFSGGTSRITNFYDFELNKFKRYNYTIATGTTTPTPSLTSSPRIYVKEASQSFYTITSQKFYPFFKSLEASYYPLANNTIQPDTQRQPTPLSWSQIIENIHKHKTNLYNLPLVRPKNTITWFFAGKSGGPILELTPTKVNIWQKEQPVLDISSYRAVLLGSRYIPLTLKLSCPVALIQQTALQQTYIKEIYAPTITLMKLLDTTIFPLKEMAQSSTLLIDKLTVKSSSMFAKIPILRSKTSTLKNLIFSISTQTPFDERQQWHIDFTVNNVHHSIQGDATKKGFNRDKQSCIKPIEKYLPKFKKQKKEIHEHAKLLGEANLIDVSTISKVLDEKPDSLSKTPRIVSDSLKKYAIKQKLEKA